MKRLLKVFLILVIALSFFMNLSVFATEANDVNTPVTTSLDSNNTSTNNTVNNTTESNTQQNDVQTNSNNSKTSTQVSSIASVDEGELSISDILNILLIAVGLVIILLAGAILIRLK